MKKIVIVSLSAALAGSMAPATNAGVQNFNAGAASTPVDSTSCPLFATGITANVLLSASNIGSYDCNTTTGTVGVSIANTNGKFNVYSLGSAGGGMVTTTKTQTPTTSDTQAQATSQSASS